jgi:hypothetical protein
MVTMIAKALGIFSSLVKRKLRMLFVLFFLLGIVFGTYLCGIADYSLSSWVYTAGMPRISFWGLCVVLLIPLFVSFAAFYFDVPILILPIAFFKAFIFGFCSSIIVFAYGDAGWLVRFLLLFSDSAMLIVLCWYWLTHLNGERFRLKQDTFLCLCIALAIGIMDYMYISPFTASLLQR